MLFAWGLCVLGLAFGGALGLRALFDPKWAARLVRLKADEQGGGEAEFRATYGGVFFLSHAAALVLTLKYLTTGEALIGVCATGAIAILSAAWAGAAGGRLISIWRDGARTRFNSISVGVELSLAFAIGLPWAIWLFSRPSP